MGDKKITVARIRNNEVEELASRYTEGDIVRYGDGDDQWGVVTGVLFSDFEWPAESVPEEVQAEVDEDEEIDDDMSKIAASSDSPVYIVARASGGSQPFHASDLESMDEDDAFDGEDAEPDTLAEEAEMASIYGRVNDPFDYEEFEVAVEELQNIPGVDDPHVGFDELPEGWTRKSVLQAWASLGGTWTTCRAQMVGDIRRPARWCAALKDEVLQTERWRNRF